MTLDVDMKCKDPDKWLRPQAVQTVADCPALEKQLNSPHFISDLIKLCDLERRED